MKHNRLPVQLCILQWVLGLVILVEGLRFAYAPGAVQVFAKAGLPNFLHVGLAWAEITAAILFLIPRTMVAGGRLLMTVLALAIVIHILHGWFDVGALLVYLAATWAVIATASSS
jgi:hypothetical protein